MLVMIRSDPVREDLKGVTPLFRDPTTGRTLTVDGLMKVIRLGAVEAGLKPEDLGTHSLRIGGATALFEAGESPLVIQTMGRWASDLYRLYVRACRGSMMSALKKQARADVTLLRAPAISVRC